MEHQCPKVSGHSKLIQVSSRDRDPVLSNYDIPGLKLLANCDLLNGELQALHGQQAGYSLSVHQGVLPFTVHVTPIVGECSLHYRLKLIDLHLVIERVFHPCGVIHVDTGVFSIHAFVYP